LNRVISVAGDVIERQVGADVASGPTDDDRKLAFEIELPGSCGPDHKVASMEKPDRKLTEIKFLPVIPHPEKMLCAGINYLAHAAETGRETPKAPSMFIRFADTGPWRSSGIPSANTLPVRINPAARTMSSGVMWLSVPI
jgi:2-keto-4-pentenoate hydratase/2-oxohepta-3-ene-1,7-dioic acid hydratase in catechol pathway